MKNTIPTFGYIYIRRHIHLDLLNVCKVGKTTCIAERDCTYATNEFIRGHFCNIYRFDYDQLSNIDNRIKKDFQELNKKFDGGTEFFDLSIISKIERYIESLNINFYSLTNQEILFEMKQFKLKQFLQKKLCEKKIIHVLQSKKKEGFKPRVEQLIIVKKTVASLKRKNKGILCLPCGVGKTLISLFVSQEMKFNSICIGVPNILLVRQWERIVKLFYPNKAILCVKDSITCAKIKDFLEQNGDNCILITTYNSTKKIHDTTTKMMNYVFDFKINDEAHHITTQDIQSAKKRFTFVQMMFIPTRYQISLTATPKYIMGTEMCDAEQNVISNSTVEHFGEIIEKKPLLWAIQQNIVCDYKIHVLKTPEEKLDLLFEDTYRKSVEILSETEKRLFLSAISAVNALNDCKKVLIYTNSKENSDRLIRFVADLLISMRMNTFYSVYNSKLSGQEQKKILDKFESAEYAIISCVYCLGEGYDFPKLDGVIFAENMTSNIRIVQSALRPCRKDKDRPEKIARLYLPIVDKDDFLDNSQNSDLQKIRTLIHEMGLEDGHVCEKISYHEIVVSCEQDNYNYNSDSETINEAGKRKYKLRTSIIEMDPRICEKIKFKIFNREALGCMTYANAKKYLCDKQCKTKQEYVEKFRNNSRLSMDPENFYGSIFNWKDYLSIPEHTYYNKSECIEKIQHYSYLFDCNFYTDYSKVCDLLHERDFKFPPTNMWLNFYEIKQFDEIFLSNDEEVVIV